MRYQRKPVVVEAVRNAIGSQVPKWLEQALIGGRAVDMPKDGSIKVEIPDGWAFAMPGDWIIRRPNGELDVCEQDHFAATYEVVP